MTFPSIADFELRDRIAAAFLTAHCGWKGDAPDQMILTDRMDAQALAGIAVTIFRKAEARAMKPRVAVEGVARDTTSKILS